MCWLRVVSVHVLIVISFSLQVFKLRDWKYFNGQIHWFSIFNSFMMVLFLTSLVSMILMRTLRNDYAKYAREGDDLETLVIISAYHPCLKYFRFCFYMARMVRAETNSLYATHCRMPLIWHIFFIRKGMWLKSLDGSLSMEMCSSPHKIWFSFQLLLVQVRNWQCLFFLSFCWQFLGMHAILTFFMGWLVITASLGV